MVQFRNGTELRRQKNLHFLPLANLFPPHPLPSPLYACYTRYHGRKGVSNCSKIKFTSDSLPSTGTYYTRHQASRAQCHFGIGPDTILKALGCHFSRLMYKFYGAWWLHVASWRCFSGFMVWRNSCSTRLVCLFSDWNRFSGKNCAGFGSIGD